MSPISSATRTGYVYPHHSRHGGRFRGWGWPATLPLLNPPATAITRHSHLNPLHSGTSHYHRLANWSIASYVETIEEQKPSGDIDGDGLSNQYEHAHGTSPASPDSDGDWLLDWENMTVGAYGKWFTAWKKLGLPHEWWTGNNAIFYGEAGFRTNPLVYDCDGASDW